MAAGLLAFPARAAEDEKTAAEPTSAVADIHPVPTPFWVLAQLVPSPEWLASERGVCFGLRWQITPFSYSFALHRRLSPPRFFVVEPVTRHGGSIEAFVSPEYLALHSDFDRRWGVRTGVRSYLPLHQRGEYVAVSLGASHLYFDGASSFGLEAGAYVLYGTLGAVVTVSPTFEGGSTIATLRFRYF